MQADFALVAYGGNDSDYDWSAISADPTADHRPRTELPVFVQTMQGILDKLKGQGVQPVLMTLPPIHARRYFDFICRSGRDEKNILRWLGDVQIIYRHQELYSDAVARLALETGTPLIPVREEFLDDHKLDSLISPDGIHLTMDGTAAEHGGVSIKDSSDTTQVKSRKDRIRKRCRGNLCCQVSNQVFH